MADAKAVLDLIEDEIIFRCIDGLMIHHFLKLNGTNIHKLKTDDFKNLESFQMLQMPLSRCEFRIEKGGNWHFMNVDDPPPYSEQARDYTREQFATVLKGMAELEPGLKGIWQTYEIYNRIEKTGIGKPSDYKTEMKNAQKILHPYVNNLDKYYKKCGIRFTEVWRQ